MREFIFRAVMQRMHDLKYFVTDGYTIDNGLSLLFGFENDRLDEFMDMVMNSEKFFKTIGTDWWEEDWSHIDLGQYTGLKDKNDIEIFEGDIIKAESRTCKYTIEFIEGGFCATVKEHDYPLDINHFYTSKGCLCEVIGNIYENPELLENK